MIVDPINDERYVKDILLLPKYFYKRYWKDNEYVEEKRNMLVDKSIVDANIPVDKKNGIYGYEEYAKRGDVIVIDERLSDILVSRYGEKARPSLHRIDENTIIYLIAYLQSLWGFRILKFGLDPNRAERIKSFFNSNLHSFDGKDLCVEFKMEKYAWSNPIIERIKLLRGDKKVYCNNKLSELHFADVEKEEKTNGFVLKNPATKRKDAVISQLSAESAYNVFTTNAYTGQQNMKNYLGWWQQNGERIKRVAKETAKILQI